MKPIGRNKVVATMLILITAVVISIMAPPAVHEAAAQTVDLLTRIGHIETALWGTSVSRRINGGSITTVPGTVTAQSCGTTTTCAHTSTGATLQIAYGSAPLVSGTPSVAAVTGISPAFGDTSHMFCTATPEGGSKAIALAGVAITKVSGSAITLTGTDSVTTVIDWSCHGTP